MKFVRITPGGKVHVVPRHSSHTLCDYKSWEIGVLDVPGTQPTCLFCIESLDDMQLPAPVPVPT
jgi:hypothetical protein